jgi:putative salt-induced outer membrane protein YdiY
MLFDHITIKLELNNKNSSRKYSNNWRMNNTLLSDQWVIEEIREETKKYNHYRKQCGGSLEN